MNLAAGQTQTIRLRLTLRTESSRLIHDSTAFSPSAWRKPKNSILSQPNTLSPDGKRVQRQAGGTAVVEAVLSLRSRRLAPRAIPASPSRPPRLKGRDSGWVHIYNEDVISMPDNWEYPWYAAWDLAFHMIPLALVDPD